MNYFRIIAAIFCSIILCSNVIQKPKFKGTKFDAVLISEFHPPTEPLYPSERKDLLNKQIQMSAIAAYAYLSDEESKQLYNFFISKSSYNHNASVCWQPHLGVYFLKNKIVVNYIEVCLDCNRIMSALRIKENDPVKLRKIYVPAGITPEFRKFINSILKKYDFKHTVLPGSRYD